MGVRSPLALQYKNVAQRAEFHIVPLMRGVETTFYPKVYKSIISTGTLLWGTAPSNEYGKRRNNPPRFKRPDVDPIVEMMMGGL